MKFLITMTMAIVCASCIPGGAKNTRRSNGRLSATPKATPPTSNFNKGRPPVFWYNSDNTITLSAFINQNNKEVLFIRGSAVEAYMAENKNSQKTFCLVTTVNVGGAKAQLRSRALPFSYREDSNGVKTAEWVLKVDVADDAASSTPCAGLANGVTTAQAAYKIADLCPSCGQVYNSGRSYLYVATSAGLSTLVKDTEFDLRVLTLKVDPKSISPNPGVSCSDTACVAQGYSCCVETQCAHNGRAKPNASTHLDYAQSVEDIKNDYTSIRHYKHLYYVCPNLPLPTPTATATPDPNSDAQAKLEQQKKYWQCLTTPSSCGGLGLNHSAVQTINWNECGCKSATPSVDCAKWNYTPIYDTSGNIVRFECYTPPGPNPTPFTALKVNVPARSVPHRFFKSTGEAVDDINSLFGSTVVNEGTQFFYLNEQDKQDPQNDSLNMNAILGQMTVELNRALPAKVISVNPGVAYLLSANQGSVALCPKCIADKWFGSFSAYPDSSFGSGLRAYGYITSRDLSVGPNTNVTGGNYEDTLYGRACFVPPTMIPFSHQKNADRQTQRLNRLETQAAFYVNGYRRDWYGFNLGAIIGSFDGVQWFAVGQGRLVTATSNQLFLAINSPMADLNDATSVTVNILQNQSGGANETFTSHDWDFGKAKTDVAQNQGASCQSYHACDSDGDCITQLGWEYMCADVSVFKSYWPIFSSSTETANAENSNKLGSQLPISGTTGQNRRCIYRGAGAPCKQNFLNLPTTMRKNFTCAPNFYCASLSSSDFNRQIAREPQILNGIFFGQDADFPGRPKDYVTASNTLSATAIANMTYNFVNQHANFGTDLDYGLCRPGKRIDADTPILQHQSKDVLGRTDYISQIAGCDSTMTDTIATFNRTRACPVLSSDNNYTFFTLGTHSLPATRIQNLCGAESLDTSGVSVFAPIEGARLSTSPLLEEKTFAQDACFRRAGATCFSDYDCSPNHLHALTAAEREDSTYSHFGGNKAEFTYWQEYLVCGQADSQPSLGSASSIFNAYDLTLNRCCRPLEQKLTLSTGGNPDKAAEDPSFNFSFDETKQSVLNPAAAGRYSRYSVIENLGDNSPSPDPYYAVPVVNLANLATATVPEEYQWMTIAEAGKQTCCGGGWVRQFADGGHDWNQINRLNLNYENFKCINYLNDVPVEKQNKTLQVVYDNESSSFCPDALGSICWQLNLNSSTTFTIVPPSDAATAGPQVMSNYPVGGAYSGNIYAPYAPSVPTVDCTVGGVPDTRGAGQFVARVVADGVNQLGCIYLPSYINGFANIRQVDFFLDPPPFAVPAVPAKTVVNINTLGGGGTADTYNGGGAAQLFWTVDASNGIFIFGDMNNPADDDIYVRIFFNAPQTEDYRIDGDNAASNVAVGDPANPEALVPGNDLYYLDFFGRLELLGIPQMTYPPLYCNSNRSRLVPGIFDINTRTDFETAVNSFTDATIADPTANALQRTTTNQKIGLNDVFSSDEVVCCAYLGKKVDSISKCCTNYGEADGSGKFVCKLPDFADLNVYFNRFVSGDGIGADQPSGGFLNSDFDIMTGEPKLTSAVYAKLKSMGEEYCKSGVTVTGAAFGNYLTTPAATVVTRYWGIVDEFGDLQPTVSPTPTPVPNDLRGAQEYNKGLKWNHHIYCAKQDSSS